MGTVLWFAVRVVIGVALYTLGLEAGYRMAQDDVLAGAALDRITLHREHDDPD